MVAVWGIYLTAIFTAPNIFLPNLNFAHLPQDLV